MHSSETFPSPKTILADHPLAIGSKSADMAALRALLLDAMRSPKGDGWDEGMTRFSYEFDKITRVHRALFEEMRRQGWVVKVYDGQMDAQSNGRVSVSFDVGSKDDNQSATSRLTARSRLTADLTYFKPTGKYYSSGTHISNLSRDKPVSDIWDEVLNLARRGQLPGLTLGSKGWIILINVPSHPHDHPHIITPDEYP